MLVPGTPVRRSPTLVLSAAAMALAFASAPPALAQSAGPQPVVQPPLPPSTTAPAPPAPPPPDAPVTSDTSGPSVPGATTPGLGRGNEATRVVTETSSEHTGTFEFGSYGRVVAASDLRGGTGRGTNVVAFGPRIVDEGNYAELELRREDRWSEKVKGRVVATLALFPPFFHFSGKPEQAIGVRNLYAQGTYDKITMWAGSRMYRGDDIYLLNWWPLDNQNTVGGGVGAPIYKTEGAGTNYETILQAHAGQQRLDNPYQFQQVPVVAPFGFGTVDVTKLDHPRTIETVKLTQFVRPGGGSSGFKAILYGELHQLAAGSYQDPLTKVDRGLPSDSGWMLGSQLTYFTGQRDTYASLVMRHARGIAAYDPLAVPTGARPRASSRRPTWCSTPLSRREAATSRTTRAACSRRSTTSTAPTATRTTKSAATRACSSPTDTRACRSTMISDASRRAATSTPTGR